MLGQYIHILDPYRLLLLFEINGTSTSDFNFLIFACKNEKVENIIT